MISRLMCTHNFVLLIYKLFLRHCFPSDLVLTAVRILSHLTFYSSIWDCAGELHRASFPSSSKELRQCPMLYLTPCFSMKDGLKPQVSAFLLLTNLEWFHLQTVKSLRTHNFDYLQVLSLGFLPENVLALKISILN